MSSILTVQRRRAEQVVISGTCGMDGGKNPLASILTQLSSFSIGRLSINKAHHLNEYASDTKRLTRCTFQRPVTLSTSVEPTGHSFPLIRVDNDSLDAKISLCFRATALTRTYDGDYSPRGHEGDSGQTAVHRPAEESIPLAARGRNCTCGLMAFALTRSKNKWSHQLPAM